MSNKRLNWKLLGNISLSSKTFTDVLCVDICLTVMIVHVAEKVLVNAFISHLF